MSMNSSLRRWVRGVRWALVVVIVLFAVFLILQLRFTLGLSHRTASYMVMGAWAVGQIVIPVVLVIDLCTHLILAFARAIDHRFREAVGIAVGLSWLTSQFFWLRFAPVTLCSFCRKEVQTADGNVARSTERRDLQRTSSV